MQIALLPKDAADARPAILEIRPGTGGDEAALFAADLLRMYQRFAEKMGWTFEILEQQDSELGGIKDVQVHIAGEGVFAKLKFESGVHRVQRVPETEAQGRVHTSAATVAVLPEAEEVDLVIPASDIRIDTMRASGAGGQHVNTTDSAVRITHIPTGMIVVSAQKSQHRNKEIAMQVLRARLFDLERARVDDARAAERKSQVGSGDRSERIRTYNFPQGRMTDHRINLTLYSLGQIMQGDLGRSGRCSGRPRPSQQTGRDGGMTAQDALRLAIPRLTAAGIDNAPRDARLLLAHAMGIAADRLTLHLPDALTDTAQAAFDAAISARMQPPTRLTNHRTAPILGPQLQGHARHPRPAPGNRNPRGRGAVPPVPETCSIWAPAPAASCCPALPICRWRAAWAAICPPQPLPWHKKTPPA